LALSKTTANVTIADKDVVSDAIAALEALPANVQALLTAERNKLLALKDAITGLEQVKEELEQFVVDMRLKLENHLGSKNREYYTDANWDKVCIAYNSGLEMIKAAADERGAQDAYDMAVKAMDNVQLKYRDTASDGGESCGDVTANGGAALIGLLLIAGLALVALKKKAFVKK